MIKFILFAIALTLSTLVSNAEPPPGPRDIAKCPVTGTQISIGDDTPRVNFKHGQELFFSSSDAAQKYFDSPQRLLVVSARVAFTRYGWKARLTRFKE